MENNQETQQGENEMNKPTIRSHSSNPEKHTCLDINIAQDYRTADGHGYVKSSNTDESTIKIAIHAAELKAEGQTVAVGVEMTVAEAMVFATNLLNDCRVIIEQKLG